MQCGIKLTLQGAELEASLKRARFVTTRLTSAPSGNSAEDSLYRSTFNYHYLTVKQEIPQSDQRLRYH